MLHALAQKLPISDFGDIIQVAVVVLFLIGSAIAGRAKVAKDRKDRDSEDQGLDPTITDQKSGTRPDSRSVLQPTPGREEHAWPPKSSEPRSARPKVRAKAVQPPPVPEFGKAPIPMTPSAKGRQSSKPLVGRQNAVNLQDGGDSTLLNPKGPSAYAEAMQREPLLVTPYELRRAVVLCEILSPPLAMRPSDQAPAPPN